MDQQAQPMQAPGQAPAPALPNMLAQQKGTTPPPQIGQLAQMPVEQLKQMFFQTLQSNNGLQPLTVLAAIKQASERQRMQQAMAGQAAQQQAAQQPGTIRDEVLAKSYAHGGIVALNSGGSVKSFADGGALSQEDQDRKSIISALESVGLGAQKLAAAGYDVFTLPVRALAGVYNTLARGPRAFGVDVPFIPEAFGTESLTPMMDRVQRNEAAQPPATPAASTPGMSPEAQALVDRQGQAPRGRTEAQAVPAAPTQRPPAASAAPAAPARGPSAAPGGIEALIAKLTGQVTGGTDPRLEALGKTLEANASERAALLKSMQGLSPEEAAARERYYTTLLGVYEPQRKAMEEARAATRQGLLSNPEARARMAAAVSGKKRFGEALGAAAGSAGEFMGERRKRAEQLEANYQTLKSQLALTMAQAQRADAEGDEKRKRELLLQAQAIKDSLTQAQMGLVKLDADLRSNNLTGLASLMQARAAVARAAQERANNATDPRRIFDTLTRRAQEEYEKWVKSPEGARASLKPEIGRAKKAEILEQLVRLAQATGVQGLDNLLSEVRQGAGAGAGAGGQRVIDFSSIR